MSDNTIKFINFRPCPGYGSQPVGTRMCTIGRKMHQLIQNNKSVRTPRWANSPSGAHFEQWLHLKMNYCAFNIYIAHACQKLARICILWHFGVQAKSLTSFSPLLLKSFCFSFCFTSKRATKKRTSRKLKTTHRSTLLSNMSRHIQAERRTDRLSLVFCLSALLRPTCVKCEKCVCARVSAGVWSSEEGGVAEPWARASRFLPPSVKTEQELSKQRSDTGDSTLTWDWLIPDEN